MSWSWVRITAVLLAIAVAGCGKLPRPFEPGAKDMNNPLLRLQDSPGVVVAPVYDAPAEIAAPMADLIAAALGREDIPATSSGVLDFGNLLESWYRLENSRAGRVDIVIDWRLSDPSGAEIAARTARMRVLIADLAREPEPLVAELAADIAPLVARTMIGERAPAVESGGRTLAIGEIRGAPGDGASALRWALRAVLRRAGVALAGDGDGATAVMDADIEVTSLNATEDRVRLVWTIRDSARKKLAVMRQENKVPSGRLSRRWGSMAFDVVLAMRAEVVETMRRLRDPAAGSLRVPPALQ